MSTGSGMVALLRHCRLRLRRPVPSPGTAALGPALLRRIWSSRVLAHGHGHGHVDPEAQDVGVTFVTKDGARIDVIGKEGQSLLDAARCNDVDMEDEVFDKLDEATEEEDDMLDQAVGLTMTSRLGCQVFLEPDLDGMEVQLPAATRNFYVDGHVPTPH